MNVTQVKKDVSRRGLVHVFLPLLLWPLSLPMLAWMQDWFVDVNAPACTTGTGTEADPFCNIMLAVAAASDGDTIHIAPGTYFEHLVLDKDLGLIGTDGQEVTILDGASNGSVVRIRDSAVTLTGLTLTNGTGTPSAFGAYGGGLFVTDEIPDDGRPRLTLSGCAVTGNIAKYGGGVSFFGDDADSALTIVDSSVGGNMASGPGSIGSGGGILVWGGSFYPVDLMLTNCTVNGNVAAGSYGRGGGILGFYSTVTVRNSTVSGNSAVGSIPDPSVGDAYGGGVSILGSLTMTNSIVSDNINDGILCFPLELTLTNSTVTRNSRGGVVYTFGGAIQNSILWDNGYGSLFPPGLCYNACLTVDHTLIEGDWSGFGIGNIDADPLFVDAVNGDYRLLPDSPCIDAGDNTAVPMGITTDLRGFPRFLDDHFTPDTGVGPAPVVDMGAFEFGKRFRIRRNPSRP